MEPPLDGRVARAGWASQQNRVERRAPGGPGHRELEQHRRGPFGRASQGGVDANRAALRVRPNEQVRHTHRGRREQFHRVDNSPDVVHGSRRQRIRLAAVGCGRERDAVDRLMRGIEHADGQAIRRAGLHGLGHVEHEGSLAARVPAHGHPVDPHFGRVVHGVKAQKVTAVRVRVGRGRELSPVPHDPVILGEDVLDDPRDAGRLGLPNRAREPTLGAPAFFASLAIDHWGPFSESTWVDFCGVRNCAPSLAGRGDASASVVGTMMVALAGAPSKHSLPKGIVGV